MNNKQILKGLNQLKIYSETANIEKVFLVVGKKDSFRDPLVPILNNRPYIVLFNEKYNSKSLVPNPKFSTQEQDFSINLWGFNFILNQHDNKTLIIDYHFTQNPILSHQIYSGLALHYIFKLFQKKLRILLILSTIDIAQPATIPDLFSQFLFFYSEKSLNDLKEITTIVTAGVETDDFQEVFELIYQIVDQIQPGTDIYKFLFQFPREKVVLFETTNYDNGQQLLQRINQSFDEKEIKNMPPISIDFMNKLWNKAYTMQNQSSMTIEIKDIILELMMQFRSLIDFIQAIFDLLTLQQKTFAFNKEKMQENLKLYEECDIHVQNISKEKFSSNVKQLVNVRQSVVSTTAFLRENIRPLEHFINSNVLLFIQSILIFLTESLNSIERSLSSQQQKDDYNQQGKDLFQYAISRFVEKDPTPSVMVQEYKKIVQQSQKKEEILFKLLNMSEKKDKTDEIVIKSFYKAYSMLKEKQLYQECIQCLGFVNNFLLMESLIKEGIKKNKIRKRYLQRLYTQLNDVNQQDLATKVINILSADATNQKQIEDINHQFKEIFVVKAERSDAFDISIPKIVKKYKNVL